MPKQKTRTSAELDAAEAELNEWLERRQAMKLAYQMQGRGSSDQKMSTFDLLHSLQADHDAGYGIDEELVEDLRHTLEHLTGLNGKISKAVRPVRHGGPLVTTTIEEEVIGDLLYWALHLGNRLDVNVEKAYHKRVVDAQERINAERAAKATREAEELARGEEANADR